MKLDLLEVASLLASKVEFGEEDKYLIFTMGDEMEAFMVSYILHSAGFGVAVVGDEVEAGPRFRI